MRVNKGITIRIKPNAAQRVKLAHHFGCNRFVWNYFLNKRREDYQRDKTASNYYQDAAALTEMKRRPENAWMYETATNSQQRTLKHLDDAYKRFFKGHSLFPRFKCKRHEQSYTLAGRVEVRANRLHLPKFKEGLKFGRELPAFTKINNITIRQLASGAYYATLSVEAEVAVKPSTGQQAGIDLGLNDFAVFSTGKRIKAPRLFRKQQPALKRAQQHLARKKKGSKRREQQRIKVAKIHEQIANARKDFLHKASAYAVKHFDLIAVESLTVKNLAQNRCLAKSISDAGWGRFVELLEYKAAWYGRELVKVGRFYPSTKACGECGHIQQGLSLSDRTWTCSACGVRHDRDQNASRNILREAQRIILERQSPITSVEAA